MAAPSRRPALAKLVALAALLTAAVLAAAHLGWLDADRGPQLVARVRHLGTHPAAAPLFILIYAAATVLALPGLVLTMLGGAVFGFGLGLILNWTGALIGACGAYLLARWLGRDAVRTLLGDRLRSLDRIASTYGFLGLLRLRLIPLVPFNALNYGAALVGVRLRDFALATAIGIVPGAAVYTYFADALVAGAAEARREAFVRVAIAGGLLILLSFVPATARRLGWLPPAESRSRVGG